MALSLLRRRNALLDEESEEEGAEGTEDTEPIPRPSTDSTSSTRVAAGQQTESFSRRVNKRNDKSYIGQMVERGMVRSSENPLSQIATAHISHIRGYLG